MHRRNPTWRKPWLLWTLLALILPILPAGCGDSDDDDDPVSTVLTVTPSQVNPAGGTQVEVRTRGFRDNFNADLPTVRFGGQLGSGVVAISPTNLTVAVPPGPLGYLDVRVTSLDGSEQATLTGGLLYTTAPIVLAVTPRARIVVGGDPVTITGDNFETVGTVTVTFGSLDATGVSVANPGLLTCFTPLGSQGPVNVWVTNPNLEQGVFPNGFVYVGNDPAVIAMEDQVFALINLERGLVGKPALIHDPAIRIVARAHSEDMRDRGFFDHQNPDGLWPWDRLDNAGIPWAAVAENIAWNQNAPDPAWFAMYDVNGGWMNSPPHKQALLDETNVGYTLSGLGASTNGAGRWYFTQIFVRP